MIKIPTVLVLGAGASMPLGFPSGQILVDIICHFLRPKESFDCKWAPSWLDRPMNETIRLLRNTFDQREIESFAEHLDGEESIDAFLEHQTDDFVDIGKAAIAAALLPFEREQSLFYDFRTRRLERAFQGPKHNEGTANNWYQLLWRALEVPFEKFQENKLRVITFNYDRSLEHYLFTKLKRRYPGKEDAEYAARVCPITHVHGRLGCLPWQTDSQKYDVDCVEYDIIKLAYERSQQVINPKNSPRLHSMTKRSFDCARQKITVIHEAGKDTDELKQARKWIVECKRLYFLGFGYHPSNVERLRIESLTEKKHMMGTMQGLSLGRTNQVFNMMASKSQLSPYKSMFYGNNYDFLHNRVDLTVG